MFRNNCRIEILNRILILFLLHDSRFIRTHCSMFVHLRSTDSMAIDFRFSAFEQILHVGHVKSVTLIVSFLCFFFFFQTDALRFCRCSSDLMGHRRVVFYLTETLLIFRGWFVRPTAGRLADVGPIRQTCLCLSEMRQRLHLESESPASLKHWLRITTYVLLQILRLQNQQKGHTLQAYETRALANSSLASLYLCPPTYPPFLQPFTRFQTKRSFLVRMDVET